jgi:hypothetical protein
MTEPHIEALVLRLLIAAVNRDEYDFAQAVDDTLTSYCRAADVLAALARHAVRWMLTLAESTLIATNPRPDDEARADLTERLEWRLLKALEAVHHREDDA